MRGLVFLACLLAGPAAMAQNSDEFGHYDLTERSRGAIPPAASAPVAGLEGTAWSSLGPFGGTVHDVAISSINPDIAIAGHVLDNTRDGRLYVSSDGGASWSPVPNINRAIHAVVFKADGTAYAGGVGAIWSSTDDGATWVELATGIGGSDRVFDIALDPSDEDRMWACIQPLGTGNTIMHSADGGATWENRTPPGAEDQCSGITVHPGDSDVVAAAFWTGPVLWVTTDGGTTWTDRSAGLPAGRPMNTVYHDGTRLLVGGGQLFGGQTVGLFSSINLGTKWAPLHDATWPQLVVESIAVDAADPDIIYAGTRGAGINRTTDGGATWEIAIGGTDDLHVNSIEFDLGDPLHSLIGTNSLGVFASNDGGANFELSSQGISELQLYSVHANPQDPQELAVAFQGVNGGGIYTSTDGGASWTLAAPPPVRYRIVRFAPDGTLYAVSAGPTGSHDEALYRREPDSTWTSIGPSQASNYDNDVFSVRFSTNDPDLILVGGRDRTTAFGNEGTLWRTDDGGTTWAKVYEGSDFSPISSIEIVEDGLDQTMLAAFTYLFNDDPQGGLLRSVDGGLSWSPSTDGLPATLLDGSLCAAADDPDVFYLSARTGTDTGSVFRTQDQGVSWTETGWSGDAPGGIACDPDDPQALYLMHTAGSALVSRSDDQGATFAPFTDGLEVVAEARDIAYTGGSEPRLLLAGNPGSYAADLSPVTGAVLRFEPLRLNFGDEIVGTTSAPRAATLRNIGDSDATALALSAPGGNFSAETGACGTILPPGGQCEISVTFTPSGLGSIEDVLTATGDGGIEAALELAGNGISGLAPPDISVDPDSYTLTLPEDQTASETLTIGNTGEEPLNWSIETAGPAAGRNAIDCNAAPGVVIHDDGTIDSGYGANPDSVNEVIFVDHFVPATYPAEFSAVCVAFVTLTGGPAELDFEVVLFDDSGAGGSPGTELGAVAATYTELPVWPVSTPTWAGVDISSLDLSIASGGVYIGVRWAPSDPNVFITADQSPPNPVGFAGGYWRNDNSNAWTAIQDGGENFAEYRALFIRAIQSVPDCDNPSELGWLTIAPAAGTTAGGGSSAIQVDFDTSGLIAGEYAAGLCIASDDPDNPRVMVPVQLTVTGDVPPAPPNIAVDPESLSSSVSQGQAETRPLTISNLGDETLDWEILTGTAAGQLIRTGSPAAAPAARPAPAGLKGLARAADVQATGASHPFVHPAGGQIALTHSESLDILMPHTVACSPDNGVSTRANQFLRTFSLADFDITSDFDVTEITFGVEVLRDTDSAPITVKLYTLDGEFTYANLTEIGSATQEVSAQSQALVTVPVTGTAPAASTLVVEIGAPDLSDAAAFFPGSNDSGESAPSYIASAGCNIADPTPFADIGFPQVHLVMTVTGTTKAPDCTLPGWADAGPENGSVAGGDSQMIDISFDASGMETGAHETHLCVGSNDPDTPVTLVPLVLNVSQGTPAIAVTPALVDFGQISVSTASAPATVTIESNGTLDLQVDTIASPGAGFEQVGGSCATAPFALAPGENCTLDYVFTPPAESVFNSIVSITSNADPAMLSVTLTGEGVTVEPPEDDIFRDRFEANP